MPEAAADTHYSRDARRRRPSAEGLARFVWRASLAVGFVVVATDARAQLPPSPLPLSNTEDARTLSKGTVLLRVLNGWTRVDAVYDAAADSANHLHPLGQAFSAESLGVRQFPGLASAQKALRALTGKPDLSLNLGQQFSTVDTRTVVTPFTLEYGLTNRLTIGAMVPIVQTHSTVFVELNPQRLGSGTGANVGPNPAQLNNATAQSSNTALLQALDNAKSELQRYVTNCGSSGCSPTSVQDAKDLIARDSVYREAIAFLYGTSSQASMFAPFGDTQGVVVSNLTSLQNSINQFLGSSFAFQSPAGANAPAALLQLQQLATANSGVAYDSIGSPDRIGIGDIEIAAKLKLFDGFADTTGGMRLRGTLRGILRLGTGSPADGTVPFEVGTGTGQTSADGGAILDVRLGGRLMATLAGQYTAYFTSNSVARLPNSDYSLFPLDVPIVGTWREGDAVQLDAMPRIQLTDFFTFHGAYTLRHQAASKYTSPIATSLPLFEATTEQRVGLGFAYSTVSRYARGRSSVPFEMSYTHLETITATGGLTPKYHRDQIEFRIYYRLRRGR